LIFVEKSKDSITDCAGKCRKQYMVDEAVCVEEKSHLKKIAQNAVNFTDCGRHCHNTLKHLKSMVRTMLPMGY